MEPDEPSSRCGCKSASSGSLQYESNASPRLPLDEDQHLARRDVTDDRLAELPQRHHTSTMSGHRGGRPSGVFEILSAISNIE